MTPDIERMSADELRNYIAARIRETSEPDLLKELLEYIGDLIKKVKKGAEDENKL